MFSQSKSSTDGRLLITIHFPQQELLHNFCLANFSEVEELILEVTILPTYIVNHALYCMYSLNYVTVAGGRGYRGFFDNSTRALLLKNVMMGREGVKNYQKLRGVIYGQPLMAPKIQLF